MLGNVGVVAAIEAAKQKRSVRTQVTQDQVLAELSKLGFANMSDYVRVTEDGDAYVDLSALDRDKAAAISEVVIDAWSSPGLMDSYGLADCSR